MSKQHKIVNNVPDFKDEVGNWITSYTTTTSDYYIQHRTMAFNLWLGINNRCKSGGSQQTKSPAYAGTENHFKDFQEFAEWCNSQENYGRLDDKGNRWQLDKDLFGKHYSPETCIFIPAALNTLLKASPKKFNDLPTGVTIDNSNNRKQIYSVRYSRYKLGYVGRARFNCPIIAGEHWRRNRVESLLMASEDNELPIRVSLELAKLALSYCC